MKKTIKYGKLLLAFLVALMIVSLTAFIPKARAIVGTGMYIDPPSTLGQLFTIEIRAANFSELFTIGCSLKWNASLVNFTGYTLGDMGWSPGIPMAPIIDYGAGTAEGFGWTSTSVSSTVSGSDYKVFFTATFKFVDFTSGSTKIDLWDCDMIDTYGTHLVTPYPFDSPYDCFAKLIETIIHPITWETHEFNVTTVSNSTVSQVLFNQPGKKINFTVTGPDGTTGFCNVTIPRTMMDCANLDDWIIFIESDLITDNCTMNRDADYTYISIPYTHSTQLIQIESIEVVAEFHSAMILLIFLMASLMAFLLSKKQLMKRKV